MSEGPTVSQAPAGPSGATGAIPGVVIVWSGAQPTVEVYRVPETGLIIGRELLKATSDDRISRQHARVVWKDKRYIVTDLGSRNGTYAGGHALIDREVTIIPPSVVRTGRTVSVLLEDIRKFEGSTIENRHDAIIGACTRALWAQMEQAARADQNLLIIGEPGSGKGRMARGYAAIRGKQKADFNPTIQAVPLERVANAKVETLILEQVGKLGSANVATLAKLLETRPELRFVTTAVMNLDHLGLPAAIAQQLTGQTIFMPPLRERPDEMSFLVHEAVRSAEPALQIHSTLIEMCLLRPWPGNSRELVAEVSRCAHTVASQGKNNIRGEDLANDAGHLMIGAPTMNAAVTPTAIAGAKRRRGNSRPNSND
jgi:transcriptional regulator of acetoin/glycerol metabolism